MIDDVISLFVCLILKISSRKKNDFQYFSLGFSSPWVASSIPFLSEENLRFFIETKSVSTYRSEDERWILVGIHRSIVVHQRFLLRFLEYLKKRKSKKFVFLFFSLRDKVRVEWTSIFSLRSIWKIFHWSTIENRTIFFSELRTFLFFSFVISTKRHFDHQLTFFC